MVKERYSLFQLIPDRNKSNKCSKSGNCAEARRGQNTVRSSTALRRRSGIVPIVGIAIQRSMQTRPEKRQPDGQTNCVSERGMRKSPEVVQGGVQQLVDHRNFKLGLHPIVVQCLLKPVVFVACEPIDDLLRHPRNERRREDSHLCV